MKKISQSLLENFNLCNEIVTKNTYRLSRSSKGRPVKNIKNIEILGVKSLLINTYWTTGQLDNLNLNSYLTKLVSALVILFRVFKGIGYPGRPGRPEWKEMSCYELI